MQVHLVFLQFMYKKNPIHVLALNLRTTDADQTQREDLLKLREKALDDREKDLESKNSWPRC